MKLSRPEIAPEVSTSQRTSIGAGAAPGRSSDSRALSYEMNAMRPSGDTSTDARPCGAKVKVGLFVVHEVVLIEQPDRANTDARTIMLAPLTQSTLVAWLGARAR